jgi:hypothetical protein
MDFRTGIAAIFFIAFVVAHWLMRQAAAQTS